MTPAVRRLLAQASVISEASAPSYEPRTSHGHQSSSAPHTAGDSTYQSIYDLFYDGQGIARHLNDEQMAARLRQAELELESVRRSPDRPEANLTPEARVISWQGVPAEVAARSLQTTVKLVKKWRGQVGLSEEWGWPKDRMRRK